MSLMLKSQRATKLQNVQQKKQKADLQMAAPSYRQLNWIYGKLL